MSRWDLIYERFFGKPRASDGPRDPDLDRPYPFPDPPSPGVDPAGVRENDSLRVDENSLDHPAGAWKAGGGWPISTDRMSALYDGGVARMLTGRHGPLGGAVLERPPGCWPISINRLDSQAYVDADQEPGL